MKANIEEKLNQSLAIHRHSRTYSHFDQFSSIEILFDHLKTLISTEKNLNEELIKKKSHLIVETFMSWYRSLPFYAYLKSELNQFILNDRWSKYLFFVLCYFLIQQCDQRNFLSLNQFFQRIFKYQKDNCLPIICQDIVDEFRHFLIQLNSFQLNTTEFSLLNILLVIRSGKNQFFIEKQTNKSSSSSR